LSARAFWNDDLARKASGDVLMVTRIDQTLHDWVKKAGGVFESWDDSRRRVGMKVMKSESRAVI
jgi:hypothetical protein